ncbi:LysR family transcriptional regulator [Streptomyces sp. NPDC006367]|uniref:LysR family transcriptional regulator n=1 Tax=unclassified Streptomyces TaxID=2593676 RepID=UPI0033B06F32
MIDPTIELRQLHYFVAVAEERNFTRAAARLSMTQPALSRAVKALERTLGTTLLVRAPHGLSLTPAGRTLLEEGRALLAHAARATARVRRRAAGPTTVTVTSPGCDAALLDRLVGSCDGPRFPYRVRASVGTVDDQLTRLHAGQADVALVRGTVADPELVSRTVRRERGHVLVGTGHRLARCRSLGLADLAEEPVVRWTGPAAALNDPALWPDGPPGLPGPEVSDGLQMLAVVRLGQAVAFAGAPDDGVGRPEGTVGIPLSDGPLQPLSLVWAHRNVTPETRHFLGHAAAFLGAAGDA